MLVTIERIETAGPDRRARRLVFSDAEAEPRLTAAVVVKALGLEEGAGHDLAALEVDLRAAEEEQARERALRILGHRERSESELRRRLVDDGYPRSVVDTLVSRLVELDLVDDTRFTTLWVRTRSAAGFGRRRIGRELSDKGIADDIAGAALDEVLGNDETERARQALRGRVPEDRAARERLVAKLVRKGFSLSAALAAVDSSSSEDLSDDRFSAG